MGMLVIGASGKVGQLMLPYWSVSKVPVLAQVRHDGVETYGLEQLDWNPDQGPGPLIDWVSARGTPPRTMLVLAGVTPASGRDPYLNKHIATTSLTAAQTVGIKRVLIASSSAVYGTHLDRAFSEADVPIPVSEYGAAKLDMEKTCVHWYQSMNVVSLRLGNIAGADALLRHAASSNDADIQIDQFADGTTPLRSYIGPETLSKILVKLAYIDQTLPSEINIAAPNPVRMGALADAAGLSWRGRRPGNTNGRTITLDTERLSGLLSIPQCASQPTEMVAQLKQFNLIG